MGPPFSPKEQRSPGTSAKIVGFDDTEEVWTEKGLVLAQSCFGGVYNSAVLIIKLSHSRS